MARHAPPFAVALFGREAFDFFLALDDITDILGIEGMFIDDATWVALGRPATALSVGLGRRAWVRR